MIIVKNSCCIIAGKVQKTPIMLSDIRLLVAKNYVKKLDKYVWLTIVITTFQVDKH